MKVEFQLFSHSGLAYISTFSEMRSGNPSFRKSVDRTYALYVPSLSIYGFTVLLLDLGRFFSFLILYTVGGTPSTKDQPVSRPLPTQDNTNTE
jgi:hypothetical protein